LAPPPPPPPAPPAPVAPPSASISAPAPIAPAGDRNALLSAIQGGARLKKAVTNDRSGAATSGKVVGDSVPPTHINAVAADVGRAASPPVAPAPAAEIPATVPSSSSFGHGKKESVDWYGGLAADANRREVDHLPVTAEEEEDEEPEEQPVPAIQVSDHAHHEDNEMMADVDISTELRVRSLYSYEGQRAEDLAFDVATIIVAHPSKSGGDWWYGKTVADDRAGFFPQTYVEKVEQVPATALYDYESTNADELGLHEGDALMIVDRSEADWWKAERDGRVYVVPAAYVELIEG